MNKQEFQALLDSLIESNELRPTWYLEEGTDIIFEACKEEMKYEQRFQ